MSECVVYWLYDDNCVCPWRHGYVGISERWKRRLWRHQHEGRFKNFKWLILFRGTREQCLELEARMRPSWGVGWNLFEGGRAGGTAPKSKEQRAKMAAAARERWSDPKKREKHREICKTAFIGVDRSGPNNSRFGIVMSEELKRKISAARTGKGLGNQNWRSRKTKESENANLI